MKESIVLDWCVADICNMDCVYCISSDIKKAGSAYEKPERTTVLSIAIRIRELSDYVKRITVNLCGGEPLLAEGIDRAIEILSEKSNIEIVLITNFKLIDKIQNQLSCLKDIIISLHISYRHEAEVSSMIDKISQLGSRCNISLAQVDYNLSNNHIAELARISYLTHKSIGLQTYNLPISLGTRKGISRSGNYKSPSGKYCLIGNMFFNISSDGILSFKLWCYNNKKSGKTNFLGPVSGIIDIITGNQYYNCPYKYCPCNYNVTFHDDYIAVMKGFDKDDQLLFKSETRKKRAILMNQVNELKIQNNINRFEIEDLKNNLLKTEASLSTLRNDYDGLKSTWSWRIGYYITEKLKFLFGWTPFIRNYLKNKNSQEKNV